MDIVHSWLLGLVIQLFVTCDQFLSDTKAFTNQDEVIIEYCKVYQVNTGWSVKPEFQINNIFSINMSQILRGHSPFLVTKSGNPKLHSWIY